MLNHCRNNAIHCKINDICIAWMLNHCKNNAIHCKINDICIAWMLNHCKNNAIHCKINDICIAWILNHYKNNTIHCKINDIYIYICLCCYIPTKSPACMQVTTALLGVQQSPSCSTCFQFFHIQMQPSIHAASRRWSSMCNALEGSAHSVVTIAMLIVLMQMLMVNCVNANASTSKQI